MVEKQDKIIDYIESFLDKDYEDLKSNLTLLLKEYKRKSSRLDKIIKRSDKQERRLLELNEQLEENHKTIDAQNKKLEQLREYDISQQTSAFDKINVNIFNKLDKIKDLKLDTYFLPADIMSGDIYSVFEKDDGSIFYYILDGQGHGIPPSLTVFYASSLINEYFGGSNSLPELLDLIVPLIRNILLDGEQLSYTFVWIDKDRKKLSYCIGGMYPTMLLDNDNTVEYKANNLPLLNFFMDMKIDTIEIDNFQGIISYTDGLVETTDEKLLTFPPEKLLNDYELFKKSKEEIVDCQRDDDITIVNLLKL